MIHTILFSKPVTYSSHAGVTFTNETTGDTGTAAAGSGTSEREIVYDVTWVAADPLPGEVVRFNYNSALGNYIDAPSGKDVDDLELYLTNCPIDPIVSDDFETFPKQVFEQEIITALSGRYTPEGFSWVSHITAATMQIIGGVLVPYDIAGDLCIDLDALVARPRRVEADCRFLYSAKSAMSMGVIIRGSTTGSLSSGICAAVETTNDGKLNINIHSASATGVGLRSTTPVLSGNDSANLRDDYLEIPPFTIVVEDKGTSIRARVEEPLTGRLLDPELDVEWTVSPVGSYAANKRVGFSLASTLGWDGFFTGLRVYA